MTQTERRKAQRVEANLTVAVTGGAAPSRGKALNISTSGIYFESPHYLAPLTKVRLELGIPQEDPKQSETQVMCDGVVVRVEPEKKDPAISVYRVAIFFTYVPERSLKILGRFIRSRLSA
jgi:c-di-GMP-binding flagellar brake protein YcgR